MTEPEVRLIDANALYEKVDESQAHNNHKGIECMVHNAEHAHFKYMISQAPTIDAVPLRHGQWIDKGDYAVCTECGGNSGTQYDGVEPIPLMTQFCPHCGAKMDGGTEQ